MNMDIGGMVLTGENRNTERKLEHIVTLFTTNTSQSLLGSNSGPHGERPKPWKFLSNKCLRNGTNQRLTVCVMARPSD